MAPCRSFNVLLPNALRYTAPSRLFRARDPRPMMDTATTLQRPVTNYSHRFLTASTKHRNFATYPSPSDKSGSVDHKEIPTLHQIHADRSLGRRADGTVPVAAWAAAIAAGGAGVLYWRRRSKTKNTAALAERVETANCEGREDDAAIAVAADELHRETPPSQSEEAIVLPSTADGNEEVAPSESATAASADETPTPDNSTPDPVDLKSPPDSSVPTTEASSASSADRTGNGGTEGEADEIDDADAKNALQIDRREALRQFVDESPASLLAVFKELKETLDGVAWDNVDDDETGARRVVVDAAIRDEHRKDAWSYHSGLVPFMVVYPRTTEEVSKILCACNRRNVSVVPYTCGTSLEGHTLDMTGGIICNLGQMDKIIEVHEKDADVVVQTGVKWEELNAALAGTGYFFPMDPGPGASIGGMIGTCCSGTNAVRYGTMKDWVLAITAVLADGRVVKLGTRARKDVAGYDLARLIIGSEGTLAVVTEATLKLAPKSQADLVAVCSFPSTYHACAAVADVIRRGISVSAAEYLDPQSIEIINSETKSDFKVSPTIFFKFSGTPSQLAEAEKETRAISDAHNSLQFQYRSSLIDKDGYTRLWQARKGLLFSTIGWGAPRECWITDVCVPMGRLADIAEETMQDIKDSFLEAPCFGHVGDGNFHTAIMFNPDSPEETAEAERLNERMVMRAIAAEGSCTGEHGIGVGKKKFLKVQVSPIALEIMKTIKKTLDPKGILNPGKIFDLHDEGSSEPTEHAVKATATFPTSAKPGEAVRVKIPGGKVPPRHD